VSQLLSDIAIYQIESEYFNISWDLMVKHNASATCIDVAT